jgi:hypothetical protein
MSSDQKSSDQMNSDQMNLDLWSILIKNKTSCLTTAFCKNLASVSLVVLSCLVSLLYHMPGRTTRKCKETLLQVKERLTREQANRTTNRIRELLNSRDSGSDSDSEEEQSRRTKERTDSLSELRRELRLGLFCLWFLIVLLVYWISSITQRNYH